MTTSFADIFSSKAKFQVLKLLVKLTDPISLRMVSSLANIPVRSTVLALESLVQDGVLKDIRKEPNRLFVLNRNSHFFNELKNIFFEIEKSEIRLRANTQNVEATKALEFITGSSKFFDRR